MWQPIKIDRSDYIIKKDTFNGKHVVLLSNFIKIWGEEMSSVNFFERCKKFNPLMEGDQDNLIDWILSLLVNENNANIKVIECDESKVMELKTNLSGIPFLFKFYLDPIDPEKFYREMTLPLLLMVQQLQAEKYKLFDLLKKKDVEIADYKMEGATLLRKNIETAAFSEIQFQETCSAITIPNNIVEKPTLIFSQETQTLYTDVLQKYEHTKAVIEALNEGTDTEDSGVQTALSDSSPEKRRKLNKTNAKETSNAVQQRLESEAQEKVKIKKEKETEEEYQRKLEEKLLAKQRKEAMKKKRLNL